MSDKFIDLFKETLEITDDSVQLDTELVDRVISRPIGFRS